MQQKSSRGNVLSDFPDLPRNTRRVPTMDLMKEITRQQRMQRRCQAGVPWHPQFNTYINQAWKFLQYKLLKLLAPSDGSGLKPGPGPARSPGFL